MLDTSKAQTHARANHPTNLVAVQAQMTLADYESAEHFHKKILNLSERAVDGLPQGQTLVAFPEVIGLPLLLTLGHFEAVRHSSSIQGAMLSYLKRAWKQVLASAWQQRRWGFASLYQAQAIPAYLAYKRAFSEAAKTFGVQVIAGSIFLPHIEEEAARGVHVARREVYNTAFGFSAKGQLLGRSRKVYLTDGAESRSGLSRGQLADLYPISMPVGKVGVAICLDAFYSSVIEHFDALGTEIIVQPSANHADWQRPWPADPTLTEGEAWLKHGLLQMIQGREHLRFGLNPMMVGNVWDLEASGRSSIVFNTRHYPGFQTERPGLAALAESPYEEAFVRFSFK
ncbi:MAG: hypothetical protein KC422_18530 [Trueperaceae bacterium]|nr:hypothetical protein [Trueperaceae bacterium]